MNDLWFHDGELLCPVCRGSLHIFNDDKVYVACDEGHGWTVKGRVVELPPTGLDSDQSATVDAFSRKWDFDPDAVREERFRIANAWFLKRFTASWTNRDGEVLFNSGRPSPEVELEWFLRGKRRILDAGCGLGNLTTMIARHAPHAEVWGVDLSTAIFKWADSAPENVRLVRCDLRHLPITGTFDLIVSDGVLHHTPNTWKSASALADRLAPGGDFLFHVYRKKAPIREFADDWIRSRVAGMTHEETTELCRSLVDIGRQLRQANVSIVIDRDVPALGIESGEHDLQRFVYWHFMKCFWDDGGNVPASIIENYDWYAPRLAHRHTEDEVRGWAASRSDLELVYLTTCESGFSVHARRS